MIALLSNREFIKDEIMFSFYGSVRFEGIKRALRASNISVVEAGILVDYTRHFLESKFQIAQKLKGVLKQAITYLAETGETLT